MTRMRRTRVVDVDSGGGEGGEGEENRGKKEKKTEFRDVSGTRDRFEIRGTPRITTNLCKIPPMLRARARAYKRRGSKIAEIYGCAPMCNDGAADSR